jgi:hypothetical protein
MEYAFDRPLVSVSESATAWTSAKSDCAWMTAHLSLTFQILGLA